MVVSKALRTSGRFEGDDVDAGCRLVSLDPAVRHGGGSGLGLAGRGVAPDDGLRRAGADAHGDGPADVVGEVDDDLHEPVRRSARRAGARSRTGSPGSPGLSWAARTPMVKMRRSRRSMVSSVHIVRTGDRRSRRCSAPADPQGPRRTLDLIFAIPAARLFLLAHAVFLFRLRCAGRARRGRPYPGQMAG